MSDHAATTPAAASEKMREMAERSVTQAREAYERYATSSERMFNTLEDSARLAWSGARDVNLRMAAFADANAKAGFEYAERLVKAQDVNEAGKIQQEFLKQSTERMGQQMKELNDLATRAAREVASAVKPRS